MSGAERPGAGDAERAMSGAERPGAGDAERAMSGAERPGAPDAERATSAVEILGRVPFLADLDEETLAEIAERAARRRYEKGDKIVAELEPGADVYVLAAGEAEVSVDCTMSGDRRVLGVLGPGAAFGEMSSITGELRSASVTATTAVEALVIADADFDRLRERRPLVAIHLVRHLSSRLAAAERSVESLLGSTAPAVRAPHGDHEARRGSVRRAWRELVVSRRRDLAFLTLAAFVLTLAAVRGLVFASFALDLAPRFILRGAYLTGFTLLLASSCASLLTYRPGVRRAVAMAYGVGLALILNELGVTLAFDIFFKDIHTADPDVPFDIERLYRRTEPLRAILIGLLVLVQAAYLRRFYRRALFVLGTRARKLLAR
jgi:CRP-like cAMP-binding protein